MSTVTSGPADHLATQLTAIARAATGTTAEKTARDGSKETGQETAKALSDVAENGSR